MTWLRRMDCSALLAAMVLPVSLIFAQNLENSASGPSAAPLTPGLRAAPHHHLKPNFPLEDKVPVNGPAPEQPMASASGYAPSYGGGGGGSYNGPHSGGGYENYDSGYGGGCYGRPAGYYGDASYDCKTFQVCQSDGRLDTMYCPPYTRFNNYLGVCDWHFKVDAYCNPLYKEEPYNNNNNYGSGGNHYGGGGGGGYSGGGSSNYGGSYSNAQPVVTFDTSYQATGNGHGAGVYNAGGGSNYGGSGSNNNYYRSDVGTGSANYPASSRPPVYNLMSYGSNSGSKYRR